MLNFFKRRESLDGLRDILASADNKETLLGMKDVQIPEPRQIKEDAARLVKYSKSEDYKRFADVAWSHVLTHIDVLTDEAASADRVQMHRGALKATLDLLRLSYQARFVLEQQQKSEQESRSL